MFVAFLLFAIPSYTYNEAQQLVEEDADQLELYPSLDYKTLPTKENLGLFLKDKTYYVAMVDEGDEQSIQYYVVHPIKGKPIKIEKPYK